jgi:hypothetical protein
VRKLNIVPTVRFAQFALNDYLSNNSTLFFVRLDDYEYYADKIMIKVYRNEIKIRGAL